MQCAKEEGIPMIGIHKHSKLLSVCSSLLLGALTLYFAPAAHVQEISAKTSVQTKGGLKVATFDTIEGRVIVNLPDDMVAGDTISGIVLAEPKGQTEEERSKNMSVLNGYVIQLGTPTKSDGTTEFKSNVPVNAARNPFTVLLPPSSIITPTVRNGSRGDSGGLGITLTNASGSVPTHGTATIPIELVSLNLRSVTPVNTFQLPRIGQQGRTIVITGPFDGNSGNTILNWTAVRSQVQDFEKNTENVSGGFGLLAESPRKAVFEAPTNVTGPLQLHLTEGTSVTSGEYHNLGVNLSAPKTSLLRGEHTTLTIQVFGLRGIKEPVPLTVECQGVITMEGGAYQPLTIQPSQVNAEGRYSTTRDITGVQAGVWGATATVVTQPFDICLQDDSNPQTVIQWNSFNGDYIFTLPPVTAPEVQAGGGTGQTGATPATGASITLPLRPWEPTGPATGKVTWKGCTIMLVDNSAGRRVFATVDMCTHAGSASVQVSSPKMPKIKFTITDRNTADNTCTCGPGCK
jgi:hypothetical protein